nr:divergent polysaccharide deacetylase family protein [Jiella sp. LLJ827]
MLAAPPEKVEPTVFTTAASPHVETRAPAKAPAPTIITPGTMSSGPVTFRVEEPVSFRQSPMVAHLPESDLIEETEYGPLPVRAADGRRPFDVYAGAWSGRPATRVAIVVGGMGISQTSSMEAVERLPAGVTLGFSPQGNSLSRWMEAARRGGHELLLQVPLEPTGYPSVDPGENTVTVAEAAAGDFSKLYASLSAITNYVGVMNYMGGRFTGDAAAMERLIAELSQRGLMYLDDGSSARSVANDAATLGGVPGAKADVMLDMNRDAASIASALDTLEKVARAQGSAIGVASAFDQSIESIAAWIPEAERRGIEIVPVSAVAYDPEAR